MSRIKIDAVAAPLSGHLYPVLLLLAPLLNDPNYEIRIFTGPQKQKVAEDMGFTVVPIIQDHADYFDKISTNHRQLNLLSAYRQLSNGLYLINIVSDQLREEWTVHRPDIVITDYVTVSGGLIAEELEIPWMTSMATQFAIETPLGPPCFFAGMGSEQTRFDQLKHSLARKLTRLIKRLATFSLRSRLKQYHFRLYNKDGWETIYSPYSILGIGMEEVELKKGFPPYYHWVGPVGSSVEKSSDYHFDLTPFSNKKKVLVSLGTQLAWAQDNIVQQTLILAQQHPECQFFVTLGKGAESFQTEKLLDNVSILTYLPYESYIPQMDYVIHHGGAGIFFQCIKNGIPALILPHDYDQYDYAIRGVEAGVALQAPKDKSQKIAQAFEQLLARKDWAQLKVLQKRALAYDPTSILKKEIHRLIKKEAP